MFRIAAATYLVVMTVAGPWFCCCMPARLAAMISPSSTEAPVCVACPDCCGRHAEKPDQRTPECPPERPQPSQPGCPCQGGPVFSAALPAIPDTNKLSAGPFDGLTGLAPVPAIDAVVLSCSETFALGARRAHPFLTADDLLHVLHMLRC